MEISWAVFTDAKIPTKWKKLITWWLWDCSQPDQLKHDDCYVNPTRHYPIASWSTKQRTVHNLQLPSPTFSLKNSSLRPFVEFRSFENEPSRSSCMASPINLSLLPNLWSFSLTVHEAHKLGFDNGCTAWAQQHSSIAWCRDFLWACRTIWAIQQRRGQGN